MTRQSQDRRDLRATEASVSQPVTVPQQPQADNLLSASAMPAWSEAFAKGTADAPREELRRQILKFPRPTNPEEGRALQSGMEEVAAAIARGAGSAEDRAGAVRAALRFLPHANPEGPVTHLYPVYEGALRMAAKLEGRPADIDGVLKKIADDPDLPGSISGFAGRLLKAA